jgi:hypothetical protein
MLEIQLGCKHTGVSVRDCDMSCCSENGECPVDKRGEEEC